MTSLQLEVLEAFRSIDSPEDKAARAAAALSSAYTKFEADVGTNLRKRDADIGSDVSSIREDLSETRRDVSEIRKNLSETRRDVLELRKDLSETRKDMSGVKLGLAGVKSEVALQRWMLGFNITLTLLGFGSVLGFLWRFVK